MRVARGGAAGYNRSAEHGESDGYKRRDSLLAKKFPLAYLEIRTVVEAAKEGRGLTAEEVREEEQLALAAAFKRIDLVKTTAESGRGLDPAEVRRLAEC